LGGKGKRGGKFFWGGKKRKSPPPGFLKTGGSGQ